MKTPTIEECHELFHQYHVPGTVRSHCITVFQVASFLSQELKKKNYPLNPDIIKPFAYLHDFMKAVVLERLTDPPYNYNPTEEEIKMHQHLRKQYPQMSETKVAYLILKDQYPEFAKLFLELDELTQNPHAQVSQEAKFIHYVDWRVLGNKVVPMQERLDYIHKRYGHWIQKRNIDWEATKKEQFDYEANIFKHLPFKADELAQHINIKL